jgi:two-component system NtrC family sensor kinase
VASASEALSAIARRLAEVGRDRDAAGGAIANGAVAVVAAEGALVAGIDDGDFHVVAAAGTLAPMAGFHSGLAGSLAGEAGTQGHAVALNEAANDPRVDAHFLGAFGPRQVAVAPVMIGSRPVGFVLALNSTHGAFSGTDVTRLQRLADYGAIALRYSEVFARAEESSHDAHALSEAVRKINKTLDLDRVVAVLAFHAAELSGARGARVALLEDTRLNVVARCGDATDVVGTSVELGRQFASQAVRHRRPVRTTDLRPYADQWARPQPSPDGEGHPNGIALPLLVGGQVIGAVTVFGNESRNFTERDETLLQGLADHAVIAIENARLYRAAAHTARHASALAAAARALASNTTPESVLEAISQVARTALGAEGLSVFLADPASRQVDLAHSEGVGATAVAWTPERFWQMSAGEVTASGQPVYASDIEDLFYQLTSDETTALRATSLQSIAFLPLPNDGTQRGVLILRFASRRRFDDPERRLLEDFAAQVAIAIRNAELIAAERSGREREQQLADTMHQTEKLAALGELVAGVAHELNNPLTGISTFAQLLLEDELGEEQRDSVLTIKREADRAVSVIRDLLVFSRKTGPRMVPIDLNALVHQTLRLRAYSLQSTGVEVRTELASQLPTILGDDQKLQQVLLNLVVNAEYAMQRSETRVLTIRTLRRDAGRDVQVVLEVIDTGVGMAGDVSKHVFEPFFTTKPAGVGTGLGLSVSYGIIQAHGGTITVASAPGAGATFTATLPMRSPSQIPQRAGSPQASAASQSVAQPLSPSTSAPHAT